MKRISPRRFSRAADRARDAVLAEYEDRLRIAYGKVARQAAREAVDAFVRWATPLPGMDAGGTPESLVADANEPPESEPRVDPRFVAPDVDQVVDEKSLAASMEKRTRKLREQAARKTLSDIQASLGISFDVNDTVFSAGLLESAGARGGNLVSSVRDAVIKALEQGLTTGLSIPDTAALISDLVGGLDTDTATMLARTDLISITNGNSILAAREVYPEGDLVKTWLATEDERTRETHADADGQSVPLSQPFAVGGDALDYPGDPDGSDEETINCRCTVIYETIAATVPAGDAVVAAAVDHSDGTMVAVFPTEVEAKAIARDGGQPWEEIHCTLAFLPEGIDDFATSGLLARLIQVAGTFDGPITGSVSGYGYFAEGENGSPCIAIPSCVGLDRLRVAVVDELEKLGVEIDENWGWVPHMTLGYGDVRNAEGAVGRPLSFGAVTLSRGPDRYDVPLGPTDDEPQEETMKFTAERNAQGEFAAGAIPWSAVLCVEDDPTEDGRMLAAGSIRWRDLPLTLMAMTETSALGGHDGAEVAGRIDLISREGFDIVATGVFDDGDFGREIARLVDDRMLNGVSVDLAIEEAEVRDAETGRVLDSDEQIDYWLEGKPTLFVVLDGVIGMATVCPFQAIEAAKIEVTADGRAGLPPVPPNMLRLWIPFGPSGVTASAAGQAPDFPPIEWFADPKLDRLTPLTVLDDGRVYGHIAPWDACHSANPLGPGVCLKPEPSATNYSLFHLGETVCEGGEHIATGVLTLDTGHAAKGRDPRRVRTHYDHTGYAVVDVRAGEDTHGIWIAGALRPTVPVERVRELRAAKVSGDWRRVNGNLELVAALCVNVPGYPVPRPEAVVASGLDGESEVVVLFAPVVEEEQPPITMWDVQFAAARALGDEAVLDLALEDD